MTKITKNPQFTASSQIEEENKQRRLSIAETLHKGSITAIREMTKCHLETVGHPATPPPGEILYLLEAEYLVMDNDLQEYNSLLAQRNYLRRGTNIDRIRDEKAIAENQEEINQILRRGSNHIRAAITRAAAWASVPAAMVSAVLQNENNPKASDDRRRGQALERDLQSLTVFGYRLAGNGSTGFGNVKPDTLAKITERVEKYYKRSVLGPDVLNVGQNRNIVTDIYHAAAVLREGLNQAWSAGRRSLNVTENKKYEYYPYFGGAISNEVAARAMGHYNGWGNDAKAYGETALKHITKEKLYFLEAK